MPRGPGIIQRKILLLLLGGLALGLSGSPRRYFRIIKLIGREWQEINRQALWRAIRGLYQSQLISEKRNDDGTITLILSREGRRQALTYKLDEMKIKKPERWDRKWRLFAFDIPEKRKKIREAMRFHFRSIGLKEFQKSIFICPYPCDQEVDFLVEFYRVRPYVRKILAESIDNELHYKQKFGLVS